MEKEKLIRLLQESEGDDVYITGRVSDELLAIEGLEINEYGQIVLVSE